MESPHSVQFTPPVRPSSFVPAHKQLGDRRTRRAETTHIKGTTNRYRVRRSRGVNLARGAHHLEVRSTRSVRPTTVSLAVQCKRRWTANLRDLVVIGLQFSAAPPDFCPTLVPPFAKVTKPSLPRKSVSTLCSVRLYHSVRSYAWLCVHVASKHVVSEHGVR